MKLLFDQNLSFKLCTLLSDLFPDSKPVRELGLDRSDDRVVWIWRLFTVTMTVRLKLHNRNSKFRPPHPPQHIGLGSSSMP
jgi:hypothetical protein